MKSSTIINRYFKDGEPLMGFTILELIISIFILSVGIVGIFSTFFMTIILTSDAADRITATYLAQEGMEIARNIRDTNWLNMDAGVEGATWLYGLNMCTQGCEATYASGAMTGGSIRHLYINRTNGFYDYNDAGLQSKFERKITIVPLADNNGATDHIIDVKVEVSWDQKQNILHDRLYASDCGTYNCITTEGTLYDWYNYVPLTP